MTSSRMCISVRTRFISSTGQGAPDIMPVRSEVRLKVGKSGRASSATNMAGTPYTEVQRSLWMAWRVARASNVQFGKTTAAPVLSAVMVPMTQP